MQKAKWLSGEALQIAVKRREVKSKGEKERYKHLNAELQRIVRRDKKAFFSYQRKEIEENNRMGKTSDVFKKIRDTKGSFHNIVQEVVIKTVPMKKKCKKAKSLSEESLQIAVKRSEEKSKGEKIQASECRVPKNSKKR